MRYSLNIVSRNDWARDSRAPRREAGRGRLPVVGPRERRQQSQRVLTQVGDFNKALISAAARTPSQTGPRRSTRGGVACATYNVTIFSLARVVWFYAHPAERPNPPILSLARVVWVFALPAERPNSPVGRTLAAFCSVSTKGARMRPGIPGRAKKIGLLRFSVDASRGFLKHALPWPGFFKHLSTFDPWFAITSKACRSTTSPAPHLTLICPASGNDLT